MSAGLWGETIQSEPCEFCGAAPEVSFWTECLRPSAGTRQHSRHWACWPCGRAARRIFTHGEFLPCFATLDDATRALVVLRRSAHA